MICWYEIIKTVRRTLEKHRFFSQNFNRVARKLFSRKFFKNNFVFSPKLNVVLTSKRKLIFSKYKNVFFFHNPISISDKWTSADTPHPPPPPQPSTTSPLPPQQPLPLLNTHNSPPPLHNSPPPTPPLFNITVS